MIIPQLPHTISDIQFQRQFENVEQLQRFKCLKIVRENNNWRYLLAAVK
jgi:hypothetical protein